MNLENFKDIALDESQLNLIVGGTDFIGDEEGNFLVGGIIEDDILL